MFSRFRGVSALPVLAILLAHVACGPVEQEGAIADPAVRTVQAAIEAHGGDRFDRSEIRFTFRGAPFVVRVQDGRFHYERRYGDSDGRSVREWMDNEGTFREVDGQAQPLTDSERARVETAINSVVYFGFLPYRLMDPAARHRHLGTARIEGQEYEKIEVSFAQDGGGPDWDDRFVYWFHQDDLTLDFLAYRYHRDGGGTRFRRAVNRRELGGLVLQDYENYTAREQIQDIAEYDQILAEELLRLLSMVELDDVEVDRLE